MTLHCKPCPGQLTQPSPPSSSASRTSATYAPGPSSPYPSKTSSLPAARAYRSLIHTWHRRGTYSPSCPVGPAAPAPLDSTQQAGALGGGAGGSSRACCAARWRRARSLGAGVPLAGAVQVGRSGLGRPAPTARARALHAAAKRAAQLAGEPRGGCACAGARAAAPVRAPQARTAPQGRKASARAPDLGSLPAAGGAPARATVSPSVAQGRQAGSRRRSQVPGAVAADRSGAGHSRTGAGRMCWIQGAGAAALGHAWKTLGRPTPCTARGGVGGQPMLRAGSVRNQLRFAAAACCAPPPAAGLFMSSRSSSPVSQSWEEAEGGGRHVSGRQASRSGERRLAGAPAARPVLRAPQGALQGGGGWSSLARPSLLMGASTRAVAECSGSACSAPGCAQPINCGTNSGHAIPAPALVGRAPAHVLVPGPAHEGGVHDGGAVDHQQLVLHRHLRGQAGGGWFVWPGGGGKWRDSRSQGRRTHGRGQAWSGP